MPDDPALTPAQASAELRELTNGLSDAIAKHAKGEITSAELHTISINSRKRAKELRTILGLPER